MDDVSERADKSEWVEVKSTGLPEAPIVEAGRRGELLVCDLDGSLFVERTELRRWLGSKSVARVSAVSDASRGLNGKNYAAEWVVGENGVGRYMTRTWLPDGTSIRVTMTDRLGNPLYLDRENDFSQAQDTAYCISRRVLEVYAVDAVDVEKSFRQERPVRVLKHWIEYVDGSGGEYSAKLRFRDNTSFLVQLHDKDRKPLFTSRKLSKADEAAVHAELMNIAGTEYDLESLSTRTTNP